MKQLPTDPNEKALLQTQEAPDIENPTGIETKFHVEDGNVTIERVADVQAILDETAMLRSMGHTVSESGDLHHIGKIPKIIVEKYCNEKGITFRDFITDDTHITRILNDPDYSLFRVWEGRV